MTVLGGRKPDAWSSCEYPSNRPKHPSFRVGAGAEASDLFRHRDGRAAELRQPHHCRAAAI